MSNPTEPSKRGPTLYRVEHPHHRADQPGTNRSAYFGSRSEAEKTLNRCRRELARVHPLWHGWLGDLVLVRLELPDLPRRRLAIAAANGEYTRREVLRTVRRPQ